MFVSPLSSNVFQGKVPLQTTRFSLPSKGPMPMHFEVTGELGQKVTAIKYKLGEYEKNYQNKKGFTDERLAVIIDDAQRYLKDGVDFLFEFIKAQKSQGVYK